MFKNLTKEYVEFNSKVQSDKIVGAVKDTKSKIMSTIECTAMDIENLFRNILK